MSCFPEPQSRAVSGTETDARPAFRAALCASTEITFAFSLDFRCRAYKPIQCFPTHLVSLDEM